MQQDSIWSKLTDIVASVWQHNLHVVDGQPLTMGQVISAIMLLVVGILACRLISRGFERKILQHFDINNALRHTLRTLSFYALLVLLILFVMSLLKLPLTAFTVIGGALAIGVGFGSQNIVNNFISGLVLMIERPVRVGDFVQQGELRGRIEHIGARSTLLRSMENINIIVPNSTFLEQQVTNWTLSDDLIRTKVSVGVAYGSDTALVAEVLKRVAGDQENVLNHPAPVVVFEEFGDNALTFDVYYWTKLRDMFQLHILASNIRMQTDAEFRENKITVAFPQRDVHLDTLRPLQVEMMPPRSY